MRAPSGAAAGPNRHGPRLEELGRGALHHCVAAVAAAGRGASASVALAQIVVGVRRAHRDQPAAVGAKLAALLPGEVGVAQVRHRDRDTPTRARGGRVRRGRSSARTSRRARRPSRSPGRRRARCATGAYRSSSIVARASAASPETAASTRGSIWPRSARTNTCAGLGDDRVAHVGRHVVQTGRRGHPSRRAVGPRPRAPQAAVVAEMLVEPRVAVGRADPLGLAPHEQRADQRMRFADGFEPPRARIGDVDDRSGRSSDFTWPGLRRSQLAPGRRVAHDFRVAAGALLRGFGLRTRARADECGDEGLGDRAIERQSVDRQLRTQQLGRRLGARLSSRRAARSGSRARRACCSSATV